MARRTHRALKWFRELILELNEVAKPADPHAVLGPHGRFGRKLVVEAPDSWPADSGWYADAGTVAPGGGVLSVWLDRYIDPEGDHHLGVWYCSRASRVTKLAKEHGVPARHCYTSKHRNEEGFLREGPRRTERARIGRWLVDEWRPSESYVGMYVDRAPALRPASEAVGKVLNAMRVLTDAAAKSRQGARARVSDDDDVSDEERRVTTIQRLSRRQEIFRKQLLRLFGARCLITGCDVRVAVEAAHIAPVRALGRDRADNGLLLRADLHRLFDAGLLTISADRRPIVLTALQLANGCYGELQGQPLVHELTPDHRRHLRARNREWTPRGLRRSPSSRSV